MAYPNAMSMMRKALSKKKQKGLKAPAHVSGPHGSMTKYSQFAKAKRG